MFIDVLCNFISLMYFYQLHSVSCKLHTYVHTYTVCSPAYWASASGYQNRLGAIYDATSIHAGCYIIHGGTLYSLSCVASCVACVAGICCSCNCEWTSSRESTHFDTFTFTFTCSPLHNTVGA